MACIHQNSPERNRLPQFKAAGHVEAGQPDNDCGDPRMPSEPSLDGLEDLKPVRADITAPHSRQHDRGHHRDPADPDHDGENMQRPGDNDIIHGWRRLGPSADASSAHPRGRISDTRPKLRTSRAPGAKRSARV